MSNSFFDSTTGERYYLGCQVPEARPVTRFAVFADNLTLTRDQIVLATQNPLRTPRRELFAGADWIPNQGNVGSCNGQAGAKALEKARALRGQKHIKLSGEGLYAQINGGRDNGSMLDDGMEAIQAVGVPEAKYFTEGKFYKPAEFRNNADAVKSASRFKALECYRIDNAQQLASALCRDFICVVAVHVAGGYDRLDSRGVRGATSGPGNHAVHVVDVRLSPDGDYEFDEAGSWGLRNGHGGYAWITWKKHLASTVRHHAFYAIRSTIDDPEDR